jgi:hypothetical protein
MKRLICCLAILLSVIYSYAQRVYFVYLQSDPEQAFYVRIKDNVYSSSASGYLILSKLRDSSYSFTVGFPQNKWPEQQFKVNVAGKDHGYILKNFGEKGWGLYDLQTSGVQMGMGEAANSGREENKDVSAFTDVLAKAANDPSLRDKPIKKEEPKVEVQQAVVKNEEPKESRSVKKEDAPPINAVATTTEKIIPPKIENKANEDTPKEIVQKKKVDVNQGMAVKNDASLSGAKEKKDTEDKKPEPIITKTGAANKTEEPKTEKVKADPSRIETVKIDSPKVEPQKTDTEVPVVKADPPMPEVKKPDIVTEPVTTDYKQSVVKRRSESSNSEGFGLTFVDEYPDGKKDTIKILIPNPRTKVVLREEEKQGPKEEKKFLDITADSKDITGESRNVAKEEKPKGMKCSFGASESDFLKLRKRMAGASGDEGMLSEAIKAFKAKCYTVDQLRNLSTLFLNDAGKYRFFDAAYATVYDSANFSQLQTELKDEYYVNRFKAMLR